jgi:tetratricopeptide (TPR) repeat protein
MFATLRKLVMVLPVTFFFAGIGWGQTAAIEGDVKGEDGKPLANAVIKIDRQDMKAGTLKTKTDKKGHYFYGGLGMGKFKVTVEVNGQDRDALEGVPTRLGDRATVNFALQPPNAAGAPPPESNRELSAADKAAAEKKRQEQEAQLAKNKALNDAFNEGKDAATAKNWDAAVQGFEKAAAMDATKDVIWANMADAYVNLSATKTGTDQQAALDKGVAAYKKAIEIKADDPAYHNNYALALAKAKNFTEAQTELTNAAQLDPKEAGKYYYNMGAVLVNTGQTEPAVAAFQKAIEADPNYADAHYQLGISRMGQATIQDGKMVAPPGTTDEFQKYLQLQPNGPNADAAKAMLEQLGAKVETQFSAPGKQNKKK